MPRPEGMQALGREEPIGASLKTAARIMGVGIDQVRLAARDVQPWQGQDGLEYWSISQLRRKMGKGMGRPPRISRERTMELAALLRDGVSMAKIQREEHVWAPSLKRAISFYGLDMKKAQGDDPGPP